MKKIVTLSLCAAFIVACGSEDSAKVEAPVDKETVFDPMVDTIDRAKEVEALTEQRKADLDKALEAAEGGNPD